MNIAINNARIIDPANNIDETTSLYVSQGKIVGIGQLPVDFQLDQTIDADGYWLIPGIVDLAVNFRDPGASHKATIQSESKAAIANGITSACYQPDITTQVNTPADVDYILKHDTDVNIHVIGNLTKQLEGNALCNVGALKNSGCVAVSNAGQPFASRLVLKRALEYAASIDLMVFAHTTDSELAGDGCVHESHVATRLGLPSIPVAAETVLISTYLDLIANTDTKIHFCRVSSAAGIQKIMDAHAKGLKVSADVAIHHLFLTCVDTAEFDPHTHVLPPLRDLEDRQALRDALLSPAVTAICSDHQPQDRDSKLAPFPMTEPGISGLDTLLPLVLKLIEEDVLSASKAIELLTTAPANTIGIHKGQLTIGEVADMILIDPNANWECHPDDFLSQGKNTPFANWEMSGRILQTWVNGQIVYQQQ